MSSSAEPVGTQSLEQGNVARIRDRLSKDMNSLHLSGLGAAPKKPPKPAAAMSSNKVAYVRFSYVAAQEDELSLEEHDVVEFLEDVEDGWARGRLRDRVGLFPTNFVSFTTTPTTNTAASLSRVNEEGLQQRMSSVRKSLINPTPPKEEPQTNGKSAAEKVESTVLPSHFKTGSRKSNGVSSNSNAASKLPNASNGKEYAKVLYDYRAAHSDELDLKEGDVIQILSRKSTDEGWCEGEVGGRRGLFPENFVRVMSATTVASPPAAPVTTTAATPPTTMSAPERPPAPAATAAQSPPLLPAKPVKAKSAERESATSATKSGAESAPNGTPPSGAAMREDSSRSPPPTNVHTTLEQRKSMLAGLQLYPPGKRPKAGFGDAANMTASATGSSPPLSSDPDTAPVVLRSTNSESDTASDEPKRLDSTAAKSRPRQEGKRPPSAHFRSSRMVKSDNVSPTSTTLPAIPSPPSSPTAPTASAPPEPVAVVSTGATTSFPAESATTSSTSASPRGAELAKELNGIVSAIASTKTTVAPSVPQMGSKHSRQPSGKDETDQPAVSRAEFDDVLKRLAALEEQVAKLVMAEKL